MDLAKPLLARRIETKNQEALCTVDEDSQRCGPVSSSRGE